MRLRREAIKVKNSILEIKFFLLDSLDFKNKSGRKDKKNPPPGSITGEARQRLDIKISYQGWRQSLGEFCFSAASCSV